LLPMTAGCAVIAGLQDRVVGDAGPSATYEQVVLQDRPLSYWRLGDPAGQSKAVDSAGDVDGTAVGAVTVDVPGALVDDKNTAAKLSANNAYIEMGDVYEFDGAKAFTVEAWVHLTDNLKGWPRIVTKSNTMTVGYELLFRPIELMDPNSFEPYGLLLLHRLPTG